MASSFKLLNNVYLDSDSVLGKAISQNDFLSLNNGYTMMHYNVSKIANNINGSLVVLATNVYSSNNSLPFSIKEKYRPKKSNYTFCGLAVSDWKVQRIGYVYFGSNGDVVICDHNNSGDCKYAIIDFNYQTN